MRRRIMNYLLITLLVTSVCLGEQNFPTISVNSRIDSNDCSAYLQFFFSVLQSAEVIDNETSKKLENLYFYLKSQRGGASNQHLVDLDESLSECGQHGIDIRELKISQINEHFQMGRLTSLELTQCYLDRISEMDVHLRSVIEVNPEAIALAQRADMERSEGLNDSPIHGIPILIKDNIGTADLMQTTAGAIALEDLKPIRDAEVVVRLRKAGAIILGKASLSEWANFRGNIPSGWNGRRGQTVNPYVLNQNPSGSSSGSAVSIAANLAAISLGTETDGSIISPSTRNAVVGLKPTLEAVSTRGVIPLAFSNDVIGPMVRSVEDASILMGVISDIDLQGCDLDIVACLENRNFKIGVVRDPFWNRVDPSLSPIIPELEQCLYNLNETGSVMLVDPVAVPFMYRIDHGTANIIFRHEFKHSVNIYLMNDVEHRETEQNRTIYSLADVIQFNEMNPPTEGYNKNNLLLSEATNGLRNKTYLSTLHEYQRDSVRYLESIFNENNVDALATPCYASNTPLLYSHGAAAGYPSITVPVGTYDNGLPFGLCLLGRPFSEAVLLKLGFYIEQARPAGRPVPQFL